MFCSNVSMLFLARFADCQVMKVVIARIEMTSGTIANAMIWCRNVNDHSSREFAPGIMPFVKCESSGLSASRSVAAGTNAGGASRAR
jgi:hypothetical protein